MTTLLEMEVSARLFDLLKTATKCTQIHILLVKKWEKKKMYIR